MSGRARLPDFLVIGSMKSGTTSLYRYLREHPQVFMPSLKEIDFFVEELNWGRGPDWYRRRFSNAGPECIAVGEASTSYAKFPRYLGVPERIVRSLPDVRLIYAVRDPVERIRSHYEHNVRLGEERAPIEWAIRSNRAYLDYSRYAMQIERYLEHFPRDRVLVISAEALRHRREATVRTVLAFLGVDPDYPIDLHQEHYRTGDQPTVGPLVAAIRNTLKRALPRSVSMWKGSFLTDRAKRALTHPPARRQIRVPEDVRGFIYDALSEDMSRLRRYVDDGLVGWGIP